MSDAQKPKTRKVLIVGNPRPSLTAALSQPTEEIRQEGRGGYDIVGDIVQDGDETKVIAPDLSKGDVVVSAEFYKAAMDALNLQAIRAGSFARLTSEEGGGE